MHLFIDSSVSPKRRVVGAEKGLGVGCYVLVDADRFVDSEECEKQITV